MLDRNEMILRDERQMAMAQYMPQRPLPFTPPPEPEEPSLLASIFRHKWIVIAVLALSLGVAVVYLKQTQPLYSSSSSMLLQTSTPVISSDGASAAATFNLQQQRTLLHSSLLLSQVAEQQEVKDLGLFKTGTNPLPYLREHVDADVGRQDDILTVTVTTPDPRQSAVIVNALVEVYRAYQMNNKQVGIGGVLKTLDPELQKVEDSIREDQAKLDEIRRLNPNMQFKADGEANSPAYINMQVCAQNYASIRLARIDAESTYGTANPRVQSLKLREEQAYAEFSDAQKMAMASNKVLADYTKITSDLEQEKAIAIPLRDRVKTLRLNQDLTGRISNIETLEVGEPAERPSFPKKTNTLALAIVAGLVIGGFLAFLRDRTDGRIRSAEEVQNLVGLQILGVVPRMPGRRTAVARAMAVHLDPRSEVAEAYRTIRTAVYFGARGIRARTLLVTSPEAGDGKTTSASNLAIAIAQTGRSVLLLDADFRKPTQHKNLDVKDNVGLSSVLSGSETLDRAIQRTGVDGLDILPCGAIPGNPSEILNSQEFGELVDRLALKYDHILFDSPPVNLVTDARILGAVCDATVLVLRADKSTRKSAEHARNALLSVGAKLLGAIVNDVPRGKGYETYGGSYYGTPENRPGAGAGSGNGHDYYGGAPASPNVGASTSYLSRLPRSTADSE